MRIRRMAGSQTFHHLGGCMAQPDLVADLSEDWPDWKRLNSGLSRLLMRRPRMADICRYLVLSVRWPTAANGSVLLRCQDDGHLEVLGSFGYPEDIVDVYRRLSIFVDLPLAKAALTQETIKLYGAADIRREYPSLIEEVSTSFRGSPGALVAIPLLSDAGVVGVLGVSFGDDLNPLCQSIDALEFLAPQIGVYVELSSPGDSSVAPPATPTAVADVAYPQPEPQPGSEGLTRRQLRVLGMMAKKMPNSEIALALDYSVSTTRLDSMKIYRYLGVHNRRDAVEEARRRGII